MVFLNRRQYKFPNRIVFSELAKSGKMTVTCTKVSRFKHKQSLSLLKTLEITLFQRGPEKTGHTCSVALCSLTSLSFTHGQFFTLMLVFSLQCFQVFL